MHWQWNKFFASINAQIAIASLVFPDMQACAGMLAGLRKSLQWWRICRQSGGR